MAAVAVAVASSCPSSACASASRWSLSPSASASDLRLGFFAAPSGLKFAGLLCKNKSERRTARPAASSIRVVAAAAAAAAPAAEEAAGPVVTTETVPRPKKIGKGIVRLRLARFGRKKRPFFRIVATHYSRQRDGKYIELLGHYDPLHAKDVLGIVVKADRIKYWLGVGAQPSDTVTGILHKVGILKKEVPAVAQ